MLHLNGPRSSITIQCQITENRLALLGSSDRKQKKNTLDVQENQHFQFLLLKPCAWAHKKRKNVHSHPTDAVFAHLYLKRRLWAAESTIGWHP